jgi:hypothetical protein
MELGIALGYGARRGPNPGPGALPLMVRDLADGRATMLPAGDEGDFAWLAGVFESLIASNPERAELLRSGIAACDASTKLAQRGPVGGRDRGGRFELTEG